MDPATRARPDATGAAPLPTIPLIDLGTNGPTTLPERAPDHLARLLDACQSHYGRLPLAFGDRLTRHWLTLRRNPYRDEIATIARQIGRVGAVMLNLSYEWACTTGVAADPERPGNRMLRTLDWPTAGLGANMVVTAQRGEAGLYYNITWPGFVGVLTAMAPGRFSAAINQPPLNRRTPVMRLDWLIDRARIWRQEGLPPVHLLRQVFDRCRTYGEAAEMLRTAPLCAPAFFILSGVGADEGCVIERTEDAAEVHEAPVVVSNHWLRFDIRGHDRGKQTEERRTCMDRLLPTTPGDFTWLIPPILNPTTRLAVVANASAGWMAVQGWEDDGPATRVFTMPEPPTGGSPGTTAQTAPAVRE